MWEAVGWERCVRLETWGQEWHKEGSEGFDMDIFELSLKRHNKRVDRERKHNLLECGLCLKKWKGVGALKTHQKKCAVG